MCTHLGWQASFRVTIHNGNLEFGGILAQGFSSAGYMFGLQWNWNSLLSWLWTNPMTSGMYFLCAAHMRSDDKKKKK